MMKYFILFILLMISSCNTFKPTYKFKLPKDDLKLELYENIELNPKPLYSYECYAINDDGVFYSTKEHDKLIKKLRNCAEATIGLPKKDENGNILKDENGNIIRYKSYCKILLEKYEESIDKHNLTVDEYNKIVKEYYDEKNEKKIWMYTTGGSGSILFITIFLIILL